MTYIDTLAYFNLTISLVDTYVHLTSLVSIRRGALSFICLSNGPSVSSVLVQHYTSVVHVLLSLAHRIIVLSFRQALGKMQVREVQCR